MAERQERPDIFLSPILHAGAATLAGAAAVLAMAVWGGAAPGPTAAALIAVAVVGLFLLARGDRAMHDANLKAQADVVSPDGSAAVYRGLLEALPEPVMLAGLAGGDRELGPRLLFANAAARDLFSVHREGGLLASVLRHPETLEAVDEALAGIESGASLEMGGSQARIWGVRTLPVASADPGLTTALVVLHDDTDVRRAERTRADFLANASHELRTPLASISGFIETLSGPARDDPEARERFLGIMGAQAGRMARLIADLLSLSRIELNEHIVPDGEVDLVLAVRDVVDALGPRGEGRAAIELNLPPLGAAMVRGDRDQIVQVAQNLIDNALKYAGAKGTVKVEVEAEAPLERMARPHNPAAARLSVLEPDHAADGRYGLLRVSDDGPGLSRQHLPRLSERFYRVEGQKSGERAGTGLGLAIVKHILNRHHGALSVESEEGRGASFVAAIPVVRPTGA